ncbi:hypothetical protein UPYG_G00160840 [Umbra pygmaea]|uniref:Uncharacterized protein n=1 Tax=Umbra pygmaea TaxID=75934 RepID=A0ABD0WLK4_UMBPY
MAVERLFVTIFLLYTAQYIEAKEPPQPSLTVSPTVIRETDSVQLSCETPTSLSVSHCYFYIDGGQSPRPSTCQTIQPGNQLLYWAGQSSPAEVQVKCFYTVETQIPSTHSDAVPLRILVREAPPKPSLTVSSTVIRETDSVQLSYLTDLPQPSLTVSPTVIRETDSVQLSCETHTSVSGSQCIFIIEGGQSQHPSTCLTTRPGNQLLYWAGQSSPAEVKLRCFYTTETYYPSTHSDTVSLRILDLKRLPQPSLTVSPTVIRETDSVQLSCETPTSVSVSQCYIYIEGGQSPHPSTCQIKQLGNQLLYWAGQSSPAEVKMRCFYTVQMNIPSTHSDPVSLRILEVPQPSLTVSHTVIRETESVQLSCETPTSVSVSQCYFYIEGGQITHPSTCQMTLSGNQLLYWAGRSSPAEVKIKCFYTKEMYVHSKHSAPVTLRILEMVLVTLTPQSSTGSSAPLISSTNTSNSTTGNTSDPTQALMNLQSPDFLWRHILCVLVLLTSCVIFLHYSYSKKKQKGGSKQ